MRSFRFFSKMFPFVLSHHNSDEIDLIQLRENIKKAYFTYNTKNIDRFPIFEYNTNRKNYEPLKESFEEEFYVKRGIDRMKNNLHIPSSNTLALFFSNDLYVPSPKILNTCRSYCDGIIKPEQGNNKKQFGLIMFLMNPINQRSLFKIILLLGLLYFTLFLVSYDKQKYERMKVNSPTSKSEVPRNLEIGGTATNAREIWIVVKPKNKEVFYVQSPIKVQDNGKWNGIVIIGGIGHEDIGQIYEIGTFINPKPKISEGMELKHWPVAEVSTERLEVIRGSKLTQ